MAIVERLANSTAYAEGGKIQAHDWGALAILVKYGIKTPAAARSILVAQVPSLTGPEKAAVVSWFDKINTVTLPVGQLEADIFWAVAILVENEFITRAECKAILDR